MSFPPDLWMAVVRYAREHNLKPGAAVRVLVTDQLREVREAEQLRRAWRWQVEEAWAEAQAVAAGDRREARWSDIRRAYEQGRARLGARRRASSA